LDSRFSSRCGRHLVQATVFFLPRVRSTGDLVRLRFYTFTDIELIARRFHTRLLSSGLVCPKLSLYPFYEPFRRHLRCWYMQTWSLIPNLEDIPAPPILHIVPASASLSRRLLPDLNIDGRVRTFFSFCHIVSSPPVIAAFHRRILDRTKPTSF